MLKEATRISHGGLSKNFLEIVRETTLAYFFDLFALIAGFLIAYQFDVFTRTPWAVALYPTLISIRVINGLLSGRLSTALHLGTIYPRFLGNSKTFYKLIDAIIVLTLVTSLTVSVISLLFGYLFWGINTADFTTIVIVMVSTLALGLFFSLITIKVAFISFRRGLDPDIIVYPITSSASSIFITLCYIGILNLFFFPAEGGRLTILALCVAHVSLVLYILAKDKLQPEFVRTIKESILMLMVVAVLVTLTGTIFRGINKFAADRKEIYTIYPALINIISNVGSVVGSTANTRLALGLLKPSFTSITNHMKNIASAGIVSLLIFTILALISLTVNQIYTLDAALNFLAIICVSNIIAVFGIVCLSFGVAIITFKRGLNPENFVIPVETSLATIITSTALLAALLFLG